MARSLFQNATQDGLASEPILTIVIVNYNSWQDVDRLIAALATAPEVIRGACEILVVDNASTGPLPPRLETPPVGVRVLMRPDNGGFAIGVNAGWRSARGRWLLLLNPDVVAGRDLPGRVLERIEHFERRSDARIGIVGFGLRDPSGRQQPSVGVDPTLLRSLGGLFLPRRRRKYQSGSRRQAGAVPWVTGACALVNVELLHALGGMDEDFFLYYEEVALCRSARRRGWSVEYDPSIEVVHLNPLQNRPITPSLRVITRHSKLLYFHKHLPAWEFLTLCRIVEAEAMVRGVVARLRRRAWSRWACQVTAGIARRMRRGELVRGREVRDLTEAFTRGRDAGVSPQRQGDARSELQIAHDR